MQTALTDEAWRVREMSLKVVGRHRLEETWEVVVRLQEDPNARVREAASRELNGLSHTASNQSQVAVATAL